MPDPFTPKGQRPQPLNRRIPVEDFLRPGTMEWSLDRIYQLDEQIRTAKDSRKQPNLPATSASLLDAAIARNQTELERLNSAYNANKQKSDDLEKRAADAEAASRPEEAQSLRNQMADLHSPMVTVEMSFNVYRTTKGKIGEPVYAEIQAFNTRTDMKFEGDVFPIKDAHQPGPAPARDPRRLGGALRIEIRCLSPTQYLGMAESDMYLLPKSGSFGVNYMKRPPLRHLAPGHGPQPPSASSPGRS